MLNAISHPPALEGRTLLDELNHRIKNELASVINLISFKAIWTDNTDAKEELSNIVDLLHHHVEIHNILTRPDRNARGRRRRPASQAWRGRVPVQARSHEYPPSVVDRHIAAGIRPVLALGARRLRADDERGPPCLLRRPRRRNQDQAHACRFLGELPSHR
jgi:hypothetical protein